MRDVVVGLSASGATKYVAAALRHAKQQGAATVAVVANPRSLIARMASIAIVADTGPEVIAGSTRLKAGTAQKMILNMLSTCAMVRAGRVYDNWMIDVALSNSKLRRRALRILQEAAGASPAQARRALQLASDDVRTALVMLKTGATSAEAHARLRFSGGDLRRALGE
jgi:N-acetylmuramic acid 6-phosphate etherase